VNKHSKDEIKILSAILLLVAAIFPFFLISLFNHPSADDFCYSSKAIELGFLGAQSSWYNGWSGRYFSTAVLSMNPLVFNWLDGYKYLPIFILLCLFLSFLLLIRAATGATLYVKKLIFGALLFLLMYLSEMPSLVQGVYWMAGTITYQLCNILTILFLAALLSLKKMKSRKNKILYFFPAAISAAAIAGSNEVSMTLLILILLLFILYDLKEKAEIDIFILLVLMTAGVACYFVISAPGNSVRLTHFPESHNLWNSATNSMTGAVKLVLKWAGAPPIIPVTILVAPAAAKLVRQNAATINVHPLISTASFIALIAGSLFPAYWSMGEPPPDRALNVTYLIFLTGWFLNFYIILQYAAGKKISFFKKWPGYLVFPVVLFYFAGSSFLNPSNLVPILSDLTRGTAYKYDMELRNRYKAIEKEKGPVYEANTLNNRPESLFVGDIESDNDSWINRCYAFYFKKDAIVIKTTRAEGRYKPSD